MTKRTTGRLVLATGLIMIPLGTWMAAVLGVNTIRTAKESLEWPTVDGVVDSSKLETNYVHGDNPRTEFRALVKYHYSVAGKPYHSDNVLFGGSNSSTIIDEHQEIVLRYPPGKRVQVHYKPDQPELAVLEPGVFASTFSEVVIGVVIVVVGMICIAGGCMTLRKVRQEAEQLAAGEQEPLSAAS